jgi:hypothetical protein
MALPVEDQVPVTVMPPAALVVEPWMRTMLTCASTNRSGSAQV